MRLASVIGHPISHSISPALYNAAFPAIGLEARFEAWDVAPEELPSAIERLRQPEMLGMMVTVPHKQQVMPLLDSLEATAEAIGAVNCIVKSEGGLVGHNSDMHGFLRSLEESGFDARGVEALVLGAGGAAHAVGYGLIQAGASSLTLTNRTRARAEETAAHLARVASGATRIEVVDGSGEAFSSICRTVDLIVNCTPVGMRRGGSEGESPLDTKDIRPGIWVYDTVYTPPETALLREARRTGARAVGGLDMLIYQAVRAIELWTGREAPVDIMREAARSALGQRT
jgi:shikimate dehydrogenase